MKLYVDVTITSLSHPNFVNLTTTDFQTFELTTTDYADENIYQQPLLGLNPSGKPHKDCATILSIICKYYPGHSSSKHRVCEKINTRKNHCYECFCQEETWFLRLSRAPEVNGMKSLISFIRQTEVIKAISKYHHLISTMTSLKHQIPSTTVVHMLLQPLREQAFSNLHLFTIKFLKKFLPWKIKFYYHLKDPYSGKEL